jgi:hypothetical protein
MDEEKLRGLNVDEMSTWIESAQKSTSLQMLIKTLQSL